MRLSDLDQVMVVADLQEADAMDMSPGQDVTVTTRDGIVRAGKVDRVAEVVDPLRRTVEVRPGQTLELNVEWNKTGR